MHPLPIWLACVILASVAALPNAKAQTTAVAAVDASVAHLVRGGCWSRGEGANYQTGDIRVITVVNGWPNRWHEVFVQWIVHDEYEMRDVVMSSEPLTVLHEEAAWFVKGVSFDDPSTEVCDPDAVSTFSLVAVRSNGSPEVTRRIEVGRPGYVVVVH